ncbi:MAG TPA: hypothetical protein VGR47_03060 [Terracidiphilus sp.]|nr:hypothetical protein [Terracidiphilus sp.]
MKVLVLSLLAAATLWSPQSALAQSPFQGTWKVDMNKVTLPKKPDVMLLDHGIFECKSCVPAFKGAANGKDQPVTGVPYFNSLAVNVKSDHVVDLAGKKDGKIVWTNHSVVSADGNTLTTDFTDSSNTNGGSPVTGKSVETRLSKGPAGSHLISGSWRQTKMENMSDNATSWSYKVNGDQVTMTNRTGQSYTARLNGPDAPMKGDPGVTSVSVKTLGPHVLQEIGKRNGKIVSIQTLTVSPDNKTAKVHFEDKVQNTSMEFVAVKQ